MLAISLIAALLTRVAARIKEESGCREERHEPGTSTTGKYSNLPPDIDLIRPVQAYEPH
jgi:hypothetical protein